MYPWKPAPLFFRSSFTWPSPNPWKSGPPLFEAPVFKVAPLMPPPVFNPVSVARPADDPVSGLSLIYRSISEWQEMARSGSLQPDQQLYDPVRGLWQRAVDYPALRPHFPEPPSWGRLLGLGIGVGLGVLALNELAKACLNSELDGLGWEDLRREVFRRDDYTCTYCGHRGNNSTLEADHKVPRSRGGSDDAENLVTACWSCNVEKGTRTEWEYRIARMFK